MRLRFKTKKIKKKSNELEVKLIKGFDVLYELGQIKDKQILVGFAAEDTNHFENGKGKLVRKNLDYIVINDLSAFGEDNNSIILLDSNENSIKFESQSKSEIAKHIIDNIIINKKEN